MAYHPQLRARLAAKLRPGSRYLRFSLFGTLLGWASLALLGLADPLAAARSPGGGDQLGGQQDSPAAGAGRAEADRAAAQYSANRAGGGWYDAGHHATGSRGHPAQAGGAAGLLTALRPLIALAQGTHGAPGAANTDRST